MALNPPSQSPTNPAASELAARRKANQDRIRLEAEWRREREETEELVANRKLAEQSEAVSDSIAAICRLPLAMAEPMLRAGFASGMPMEPAALIAATANRIDLLTLLTTLGASLTHEPHPFFRQRQALEATPLMAAAVNGNLEAAEFLQKNGEDPFADGRQRRKAPPVNTAHSFAEAPDFSAPPPIGFTPVEAAVRKGHEAVAACMLELAARNASLPQNAIDRVAAAMASACDSWCFSATSNSSHLVRSELAHAERRLALAQTFLSTANLAAISGPVSNLSYAQAWVLRWGFSRLGDKAMALHDASRRTDIPRARLPFVFIPMAMRYTHMELRPLADALCVSLNLAEGDRRAPDGIGVLAAVSLFSSHLKKNVIHVGRDLLARGALIHAPTPGQPWACPWLFAFLQGVATPDGLSDTPSRQMLFSLAESISKAAADQGRSIPAESRRIASLALAHELAVRAGGHEKASPGGAMTADQWRRKGQEIHVFFSSSIRFLTQSAQGSSMQTAWSGVLNHPLFGVAGDCRAAVDSLRDGDFLAQIEGVALAIDLERSLAAQTAQQLADDSRSAGADQLSRLAPARPPRRI